MEMTSYGKKARAVAACVITFTSIAIAVSQSLALTPGETPFLLGDGNHPDVCVGPADQVHVVWMQGSNLYYRHFNGSLWDVEETVPTSGSGVSQVASPEVWVDVNNVPHIVWGDDGGFLYYINKEGGSWSTPELIVDNPDTSLYYFRDVRIAVASDGKRHVVWRRQNIPAGRGEIFHMLWDNGWGQQTQISEGTNPAKNPHLALGDDDALHVVWRQGGGNPTAYQVMYRKWVSGAFEPIIMATDTPLRAGDDPHVATDPSNNPHVSFPEDYDVGYIEWLGDSFSEVEILGTGEDPVIAIDGTGARYVFWDDEYTINTGGGWSLPQIYDAGAIKPDVMAGPYEAHVAYRNGTSVWYLSLSAGGEPASLTVSSPNGGEVLLAGSESLITWQWTGAIDSVQLQYSPDDGASWEVIEPSYPNLGTYSWTVPTSTSTLSKVRILDVGGSQVSDESDSTFIITDDMTAPAVDTLYLTSASGLTISFTEPVEESSAELTSNYVIDNGIVVVYAVLDENLTDVHLATTHHVPGITYTITINGIRDRAVPPNTIAQNTTGEYEYNPSVIGGGGDDPQALPKAYSLSQNFPNPFNPSTRITFTIPEKGSENGEKVRARLAIYNLKGQLVKILFEGELAPGYHTMTWDGRDDYGKNVGSGTYLYHLRAGNFNLTKKMTLVK